MTNIKKYPISDGVNLYYIPAGRFKTVDIEVSFYMPLSRKSAAMNALIAPVLKSGCEKYPTAKALNRRLEELYGASLTASSGKQGDTAVIEFSMQYVNPQFLNEELTPDAVELLCDCICNPVTEGNSFKHEYVELERKNLVDSIESLINDKKAYAAQRCKEEMCKDEPYGIYSQGDVETVKAITAEQAYEFYKETVLTSKCDIFICGKLDIDEVFSIFKARLSGKHCDDYPASLVKTEVSDVKRITEELDVEQGKLSLGFRTKVQPDSREYYALAMFNRIFGGTATSKLFNNVREKLSLAYYVSSQLERSKGIMTINAGIEVPTFSAAYDEIMVQLDAMKKGDFSAEEQHSALASAINSIGQIADSPRLMIKYYSSQLSMGIYEDPDEYLEKLKSVTREEIIAVANKIALDTVYFLKNREGE